MKTHEINDRKRIKSTENPQPYSNRPRIRMTYKHKNIVYIKRN